VRVAHYRELQPKGKKTTVELLLEKGANVNAQGGHNGSALWTASSFGWIKIVELLLKSGAK